jgi:hypothetical protein
MADGSQPTTDGAVLEGDTGTPETDTGRSGTEGPPRYSLDWWLSFLIPISIALVAIMGAVVGYRAEYHDSQASASDTDAQVASTYASGNADDALLTGTRVEFEHDLWESLTDPAGQGTGQAMVEQAEPSCANTTSVPPSLPAVQGVVDCQLAQVFSKYAFPPYWEHGNPALFDTERFVSDWLELSNLGRDVAVNQHEKAANTQRNQERRLLRLALLLALALALCTLAQAALHHRWTSRTSLLSLLLAIPGWILLLGCGVAVLVWEV